MRALPRNRALPVRCPVNGCGKIHQYNVEEVRQKDGSVIARSSPCPQCGYSQNLAKLTARGVVLRDRLMLLRRVNTNAAREEAERVQAEYEREFTALDLTK